MAGNANMAKEKPEAAVMTKTEHDSSANAGRKDAAGRLPAALRQGRIIASFDKNGFVSISDLSAELGVSGMTIRRDLDLLGKKGLLERTHGGAVAAGPLTGLAFDEDEPAFEQRMRLHALEKSSIAHAAAGLVGAGESVGLDVGTSILALATALLTRRDLRVFTNNLRVGMQMAEGAGTVYILGGQVRVPEYSVIGQQAVDSLRSHFLDKVFIGVSGIDASGYYDYSPEDTEVKRAFMASAGQVIVLCDASKFNRRALSRISELGKVHVLVTDSEPPAELANALAEAGTNVIVAK
jgi:DeoR/GlpR family transcriptional regulator of sugar metabolism